MQPIPIVSRRDFCDVPRAFIVTYLGQHVLFDCPFGEDLDEYSDEYRVYLMPASILKELSGSWKDLRSLATRTLGAVRVEDVHFDDTRRQYIDSSVVCAFLPDGDVD